MIDRNLAMFIQRQYELLADEVAAVKTRVAEA